MSYENEHSSYRSLQRLADSEQVKALLSRSHVLSPDLKRSLVQPLPAPVDSQGMAPDLIVAIDGSANEIPVKTGYPGAMVGYITVASVLLNLAEMRRLDANRPADPRAFRTVEEPATIDAVLPGANVVTRTHRNARDAFREELYEVLNSEIIDAQDGVALLDTYQALLALKPKTKTQECPYAHVGCELSVSIGPGVAQCPCPKRETIWSTDALRIHEGFRDTGGNGELLGELMQVWERILLIHLLRVLERRSFLKHVSRMAFFVDGPLAIFGHPAWLSAAISKELKRLNEIVHQETGRDLIVVGIEKTGNFVSHFNDIDMMVDSSDERFPTRSLFIPDDAYIKQRVVFSDSPKRYGADTYFGRKVFYKTQSGARIVANLAFLNEDQDQLENCDFSLYPSLGTICNLLDQLVSCRYQNALAPIVSAHANAAIPLRLGAKVMEQLARALMRGTAK